MSRSNFILPLLALLGLALFFFFLVRVLLLRYERGDIYPAYSTLRADPLGTRAYYEALDTMPGCSTTRGFSYLNQELAGKPGSLFYLGLNTDEIDSFSKDEVAELDAYVQAGGRVVLTFSPEEFDDEETVVDSRKKKIEPKDKNPAPSEKKPADETPAEKDDASARPQTEQEKYEREELRKEKKEFEKDGNNESSPSAFRYHRSLAAVWGFGWDNTHDASKKEKAKEDTQADADKSDEDKSDEDKKPEVLAVHPGADGLESAVPWKSAIYFVRLEPEWQILYRAKDQPVLIRRTWGKGEIVIASDSYIVSNEALRNNRYPALLSMLAGPAGPLLFDETHLGTQRQEGVMFLVNKFRLEGYLCGALAVMVLFLWRNSVPLVPPRPAPQEGVLGGVISGKDSRSGLVNLLRRNIGASEILPASFAEWKRTVTPAQSHLKEKMAAMTETLSGAELKRPEQIVETYHRLREINSGLNQETYAAKS